MPKFIFFDFDRPTAQGMQYHLSNIQQPPPSPDKTSFQFSPQVLVGDIIQLVQQYPIDTLVSPANSFGGMAGGIDGIYSRMFPGIEDTVQRRIAQLGAKTRKGRPYLPIGSACMVSVQLHPQLAQLGTNVKTKYLICAPTMFYPQSLRRTPENVYYVMLAIFHLTEGLDMTIGVPGMGTGVGGLSGNDCGAQMAKAIKDYMATKDFFKNNKIIPHNPDDMTPYPISYPTGVMFTTNLFDKPRPPIDQLYYLGNGMACYQTVSFTNQDIPEVPNTDETVEETVEDVVEETVEEIVEETDVEEVVDETSVEEIKEQSTSK